MNYACQCKICKRPLVVTDEEFGSPVTPEHWLRVFIPVVTCNTCYDRRQRFQMASEAIQKGCWSLYRARQNGTADEAEKIKDRIKGLLTLATRKYAEVMAEYRNLARPVWDEDFVWQLLDHPEKVDVILKQYRKLLWQATAAPVQQEPTLPYVDA